MNSLQRTCKVYETWLTSHTYTTMLGVGRCDVSRGTVCAPCLLWPRFQTIIQPSYSLREINSGIIHDDLRVPICVVFCGRQHDRSSDTVIKELISLVVLYVGQCNVCDVESFLWHCTIFALLQDLLISFAVLKFWHTAISWMFRSTRYVHYWPSKMQDQERIIQLAWNSQYA